MLKQQKQHNIHYNQCFLRFDALVIQFIFFVEQYLNLQGFYIKIQSYSSINKQLPIIHFKIDKKYLLNQVYEQIKEGDKFFTFKQYLEAKKCYNIAKNILKQIDIDQNSVQIIEQCLDMLEKRKKRIQGIQFNYSEQQFIFNGTQFASILFANAKDAYIKQYYFSCYCISDRCNKVFELLQQYYDLSELQNLAVNNNLALQIDMSRQYFNNSYSTIMSQNQDLLNYVINYLLSSKCIDDKTAQKLSQIGQNMNLQIIHHNDQQLLEKVAEQIEKTIKFQEKANLMSKRILNPSIDAHILYSQEFIKGLIEQFQLEIVPTF